MTRMPSIQPKPRCAHSAGSGCAIRARKRARSRAWWGRYVSRGRTTTVLTARVSVFPLRRQLELQDEGWSEGMARQAVWLSGLVPFEQAERILQEIGQVNISRCSIWRRSQVWGAQYGEVQEAERAKANALPEKWQPPSRAVEPDRRM